MHDSSKTKTQHILPEVPRCLALEEESKVFASQRHARRQTQKEGEEEMKNQNEAPQDPILSMLEDIHFRASADRDRLASRIREYCRSIIIASEKLQALTHQEYLSRAIQEMNAERREFQQQCEALEESIREIKKHGAEEVINAITRKSSGGPYEVEQAQAERRR